MIPIIPISESRQRKRQQTKGRQVDPSALEAVRKLLGDASRQKDLLIEHLHKIMTILDIYQLPIWSHSPMKGV